MHVPNWLNNARQCAHKNATIFLVGNKKDLKDERVVSFTEAARFCQENGKNKITNNRPSILRMFRIYRGGCR